ncbi:MAG: class II fructose-bisphosphate aldolase [Desulfobacteraceae bacterium]|nr:MAG: class II fructose-bisphosphate aldolase [Desulfobacteraceae bacterium]
MLYPFQKMLARAREQHYAVGAFNVYNLEGVQAVVQAAQDLSSPAILQILPSALAVGGISLIQLCTESARQSTVPIAVHLDHCPDRQTIRMALEGGIGSVMADGSMHAFDENVRFTREMVNLAREYHAEVEGELGRLSGSEDGARVDHSLSELTDPAKALGFVNTTGVSALAVCIGNIHGKYPTPPDLDFDRLKKIQDLVPHPLVLHGTSGLPDRMIRQAVELGVCKFNVNTEVRGAYLDTMAQMFATGKKPELVDLMTRGIQAMKQAIIGKIRLFGSENKAFL